MLRMDTDLRGERTAVRACPGCPARAGPRDPLNPRSVALSRSGHLCATTRAYAPGYLLSFLRDCRRS